jgi:hypothetical protein
MAAGGRRGWWPDAAAESESTDRLLASATEFGSAKASTPRPASVAGGGRPHGMDAGQRVAYALDRRMRAMASLATVAFVIFGFSASSLLQPNLFDFNREAMGTRFTVLMALTVLMSGFGGFVFVAHFYVGERLVSEGVPELAWRLLVKTSIVRWTRVVADLGLAASCASFVGAVFLKMLDSYEAQPHQHHDLRFILTVMVLTVALLFLCMMVPLFVLFHGRP